MAVAEALVLLLVGLLCGIIATVADVLLVGAASFLSHFALWVLLISLIAMSIENRFTAIWWSIPFSLGFIESYFLTTAASYEGYAKSLVVPLAGMALLAPLLANAVWTAKSEKNVFGRALSVGIVVATLVASYVINGSLSAFAFVTSAILALFLLVVPVRRLRVTRVSRKQMQQEVAQGDAVMPFVDDVSLAEPGRSAADEGERRPSRRTGAATTSDARQAGRFAAAESSSEAGPSTRAQADKPTKRQGVRPTKRRGGKQERVDSPSARSRRALEREEARNRELRLREAARRSNRQEQELAEGGAYVSTLGNARVARPSARRRSTAS